jgi:hypothetical protein
MKTKPIPGFPAYEIADDGRVFSYFGREKRELAPFKTGVNIPSVALWRDGGRFRRKVHLLVLLAFVGPPGKNQVAMHLDADPTNNKLSNLKWGTRKENQQQMFLDEHAHWQKITAEQVREIRAARAAGESYKSLMRRFGLKSMTSIWNIVTGVTWSWLK